MKKDATSSLVKHKEILVSERIDHSDTLLLQGIHNGVEKIRL
jgi:hypothetical protein